MARTVPDLTVASSFAVLNIQFAVVGVQICLCLFTVFAFQRAPKDGRMTRIPFMVLSFLVSVLYSVHCVTQSINLFGMYDTLVRDESMYFYEFMPGPVKRMVLMIVTEGLIVICGNGILIYRCSVIWPDRRWVLIAPALLYLASIATWIVTTISSTSLKTWIKLGGVNLSTGTGVAWIILSVVVNCSVTALIAFRILLSQRRLAKSLSQHHIATYTHIVIILLESSLPLTIAGVVTIVAVFTYNLSVFWYPLLTNIWYALCALSPQIVIFRVMSGQAWAKDLGTNDADVALSQPMMFAHDCEMQDLGELESPTPGEIGLAQRYELYV